MPWSVEVDPDAIKYLTKIPAPDARRVHLALKGFIRNPFSGDIKKLRNEEGTWRRRIGSYRIFFKVFPIERQVVIYEINRRISQTY